MSQPRQHGTRARYVHGPSEHNQPGQPCRCDRCRRANTEAQRRYNRLKAQERWGHPGPSVDADPVRAHLRALSAAGVGWKRAARLAGLNPSTVAKVLYGAPAKGREPCRKVRRRTAAKLLAVRADDAVADGTLIPAVGTQRRLQALVARGWSMAELARHLGKEPTNLPAVLEGYQVRAGTARSVARLYDELWNAPPPENGRHERTAATKARRRAARLGWMPPMAWDDDTIDNPQATPDLGAQTCREEALAEDSDELLRQGCTLAQAAERLGVTVSYLRTVHHRLRNRDVAA